MGSWEVNKFWLGDADRGGKFREDPELDITKWYQVGDDAYAKGSKTLLPDGNYLVAGHMSAAEDRSRTKKDLIATFLTTNVLPQHPGNNGGPWKALEDNIQEDAKNLNRNFYIIAGGYGNKTDDIGKPIYIEQVDDKGKTQKINVPSHTWKVVVTFNKPGESIDNAVGAFAVWMANDNIPGTVTGKDWKVYVKSVE